MCDYYENYEKLAEAIILLAVEDYRKSCCNQTRYAIERFFRSDWVMVLTDIDGEKLIKKLRAERMMNREYKNLYLYTKMRNVGGIAKTEAQKSSDLFMKTQYLDEITGGKGVIFATGTPVSNSMVELYTMQRYLQYNALREKNLQHFDAWASTFGETITAIELAPEGYNLIGR